VSLSYYRVYRNPNIGMFIRANDRYAFAPSNIAATKARELARKLNVQVIRLALTYSLLIGPFIALNNRGLLLPRIAFEEGVRELKRRLDMHVEVLDIRPTCLGNLIAANSRAALVSKEVAREAFAKIRDALEVESVEHFSAAGYHQVGSVLVVNDAGGVIHPEATSEEVSRAEELLGVKLEPATVNGGVPFVSSGLVANNSAALVGALTTGPELAAISRAFRF